MCLFVLCIVQKVERRACTTFSMSWPRLEGVVSPLRQRLASGKETPKLVLVRAFHLSVSRTGSGDGCLFFLEPRASDLTAIKFNEKGVELRVPFH